MRGVLEGAQPEETEHDRHCDNYADSQDQRHKGAKRKAERDEGKANKTTLLFLPIRDVQSIENRLCS